MLLRFTKRGQLSPGLLEGACIEKQRRRSGVVGFHSGMASSENGMLKGRGERFGQLERCSSECQSVAQTDQGERSTRLGWSGMCRACFEAGAWLRRELGCCTNLPNEVNCQPGLVWKGHASRSNGEDSGVVGFYSGRASSENGMLKGRG